MLGTLLVGRYQIRQMLGGGGFGKTYIALDTQRPGQPKCVVKHFQPVTHNPEFMETARRLFTSEAETLERLGHHDQIPRLLAYFEEHQEFFLVQEFIDGHSLKAEMPPNQPWTEKKVIILLQQALDILQFIHLHKVIHRDIKPENILRRLHDGKLVLIDFGAVKEVQTQISAISGQTEMTVAIGTPGYMSLEQFRGKPRLNSDIYSLGIVCIQALTGVHPRELAEDPVSGEVLWQNSAEVSPVLASVLSKMVINNFKLRYQSATEVLEALQQNFHLQAETQITVAPSTLTQQPPLTLSQQQRLGLHSSNSSILSLEQYNYLENVLTTFVGPIAATLLRRTASASSYQELIDSLALHLTANQQTEFKKKVEPLLEQPTIKYENISNSLPEKIQPTTNSGISDALVRECERELLDLIGPIAVFLIQKAKKSTSATTSRTEFIKIVSDEIPDAQKAWQFQQRLLS
ncbi:protein kinase domain-containing protein [Anabaena sp. FACHB-709]|uniref:non-specific serine/threonine protein kinase n=2 Tax=Nostocaceae TaxID=1162 RepID=A0A1Z4KFY7_ANAVA|nr:MULTISPECIES: serine/threonine-protein kinase [Nostocaceae]BAY67884.1 serine/threonine kinase [Trichormus variabilis NIES-23]HBW29633.1 serine/threonine protein kinase [Nostoc sp. UBA8866]MBD2170025.1 serine/threonine protein kinase [Anabaena cylindrica FACHB-318]MBD2261554.1 serine/threonine protein kinase [Anabaena sp. FACHB-709]MBD2271138.1 serine/threonine protein kinase [Nostoc sp. PCC 7120 = FACHB-418]